MVVQTSVVRKKNMCLYVCRFYFIFSIFYRIYIFKGRSDVTWACSEKAVYVDC